MINLSNEGDQVWVMTGRYTPNTQTNRTVSLSMKNGVAIYGGFSGSETTLDQRPPVNPNTGQPSSSTLSGDIGTAGVSADNSYHIIRNAPGLTETAILDGFVVAHGNANSEFNDNNNNGGGLFNEGSDNGTGCNPTIRNCLFSNNAAVNIGGAVFNKALFGRSTPQFINCLFRGNMATTGGAIGVEVGYATAAMRVVNSAFEDNTARVGGAVFNQESGNTQSIFINCLFRANVAANRGGAIYNNLSRPQLTNCTFLNNTGQSEGGAMFNSGNSDFPGQTQFTNCLFFGNGGIKTLANIFTGLQLTYCLYEPAVRTAYNVDASGPGNLTTTVSPFASPTSTALNPCGVAVNAGLTAAPGLSGINTDLAGNARVFNGQVDMGALEVQATFPLSVSITATNTTPTPGTSVTLTASGATAYRWDTGASTAAVSVTPAVTTTYSVTGTAGGCVGIARITITPACGSILFVTQAGAGKRDGSSWSDAYAGTSLQVAIDRAAGCGAQVWVATGTYKPTTTTDRSISFMMRDGVAIYGGFTGNETTLAQRPAVNPVSGTPSGSTLSGNIGNGYWNDYSWHIIRNGRDLTSTAVLDGFVLVNSYANGPGNDNRGGAIYNDGTNNGVCSPIIRNCLFEDNNARGSGGAIYNAGQLFGNSSPQIINCAFRQNWAGSSGGAVFNAALDGTSSPTFIGCFFSYNTANDAGGAIYNDRSGTCNPKAINCAFIRNVANDGGAVANISKRNDGVPEFINCSFANNFTYRQTGGAIANIGFNEEDKTKANPTLVNCVLYNNGSVPLYNFLYEVSLSYSLFAPDVATHPGVNTSGPGNLTTTTSPFADTSSAVLNRCTPAINSGLNTALAGTGVSTDLAGNPRLVGDRIDMGAYESLYTPTSEMFSLQNGLWDSPATWSCGREPLVTDRVRIRHVVTIPYQHTGQVQRIDYDTGGQLWFETRAIIRVTP